MISFNNITTEIDEYGIERIIDFQPIESSYTLPSPLEDSFEASPPGAICPICGTVDIDISNGHMICYECGSEASFGGKSRQSNKEIVTPIKKCNDACDDIIESRFEILDL